MAVAFGANNNNVNINLQGAKGLSNQSKNTNIGDFVNVGKVANEAAQLGTQVMSTNNTVQADNAKQDYLNVVTSEGYLSSTPTLKAEMLEEVYAAQVDMGDAYQSTLKAVSAGEYSRQYEGRAKEVRLGYYNKASSAYTAWKDAPSSTPTKDNPAPGAGGEGYLTNSKAKVDTSKFVDDYSKLYPGLEPSVIRNALVGTLFSDSITKVASASNRQELADIQVEIGEDMKPFKNPMFLNTRQKEGAQVVKAQQAALANAIKAKNTEFKNQSYQRLADATQGGYRTLPSLVKDDIDVTASNVLAAEKQLQEYTKKYIERTAADTYTSNNPIGDRTQPLPKDNKLLMKERQQDINTSLSASIKEGNYEDFSRIAFNEKDFGKATGEYLLNIINQATDPTELGAIMGFLGNVNETNQGPTALRQMFTDDQYTRLSALASLSKYSPEKSVVELREAIDKADSSTEIVKLEPATNMEIQEYAVKLGKQGQNFLRVINQYKKINPQLAKDNYEDVANYFLATMQEDSSLGGVKSDTTMGKKPEALNQDSFDERITKEVIKDGDSVTWMTNSTGEPLLAVHDKLGATKIVNLKTYLDENKRETEIAALQDKDTGPLVDAKSALKSFGRTLVDNAFDTVSAVPEVLGGLVGNMAERLGNHMIDSMSPAEAKFFGVDQKGARTAKAKALKENEEFSAFMFEGLKDIEQNNSNLDPDASINTQDKYTEMTMREAIATGNIKAKQAGDARAEIIGIPKSTLEHIELREGSRDASYKDSLGKLTGGVGHLMTAAEQKKYPEGTAIPQSVRHAWLKSDTNKAYTAAKEQAATIGNTSEEFITALTSVNFQMGTGWTKKFPTAYKNLKAGDYEGAIEEIVFTSKGSGKKSNWNKQTPTRVNDFVEAIRKL